MSEKRYLPSVSAGGKKSNKKKRNKFNLFVDFVSAKIKASEKLLTSLADMILKQHHVASNAVYDQTNSWHHKKQRIGHLRKKFLDSSRVRTCAG